MITGYPLFVFSSMGKWPHLNLYIFFRAPSGNLIFVLNYSPIPIFSLKTEKRPEPPRTFSTPIYLLPEGERNQLHRFHCALPYPAPSVLPSSSPTRRCSLLTQVFSSHSQAAEQLHQSFGMAPPLDPGHSSTAPPLPSTSHSRLCQVCPLWGHHGL